MKGAKDEGFRTMIVVQKAREGFYRRFRFIDEFVAVESFSDVVKPNHIALLKRRKAVMIPHGTFISDLGLDSLEGLDVPLFGNRRLFRWESDRTLKERLTKESGLTTPRSFSSPEEIDRLVIVKQHGARGGYGYFLAKDGKSFAANKRKQERSGVLAKGTPLYIQEYIVGVPVYLQLFYSPLRDELELLGIERRYETTADAIGRIPADLQDGVVPSYLVVGNFPLVLRESLLDGVYKMGERFVDAAKRLVPPGMIGPFCLEGVYDHDGNFVTFEFSARIVAGTNLYVQGSPYSALLYDVPVSMGRRIAMEISNGIREKRLDEILT